METTAGVLIGAILALILCYTLFLSAQPEIKREELYRFCLVKNIKLEDCMIPPHATTNHRE